MTKHSVDIVIPVHDALNLVKECLATVHKTRQPEHHRIILIDDGSEDATAQELRGFASTFPAVELLTNSQATGFTKAANKGLRHSTAEMVIVLNSDTQVSTGWIDKMESVLFDTPGVGIVGPLSNAASHQSIPRTEPNAEERLLRQTATNSLPPGMTIESASTFLESIDWKAPIRVPLVHGFCFAISRALIDAVGYFDEVLFPHGYGEENDYCLRATDAGWSLAIAPDTYVWHHKSGSYDLDTRAKLAKQGGAALREKYGAQRIATVIAAMRATSDRIYPHVERISNATN